MVSNKWNAFTSRSECASGLPRPTSRRSSAASPVPIRLPSESTDLAFSQLLRRLNHELRTPLNAGIAAIAQLDDLRFQHPLHKVDSSLVEVLKESIQCSSTGLDDALLKFRMTRRSFSLEMLDHNLYILLLSVCNEQAMEAKQRNVSLTIQENNSKDNIIPFDIRRIHQTVRHMLKNVLRQTPQDGSLLVTLDFIDQKAIFNLKSSSNAKTLIPDEWSVYERILVLHDGSIKALPEEMGYGFSLELGIPLKTPLQTRQSSDCVHVYIAVANKTVSNIGNLRAAIGSPLSVTQLRFLVVDDSRLCRKMIIQKLRGLNIICEEAEDGGQAVIRVLDAARNNRPYDAITMDNTMPFMNGTIATKMIRESGYKGAVFGVTGNALEEDVADFYEHGADKIYLKPLMCADYSVMATWLSLSGDSD